MIIRSVPFFKGVISIYNMGGFLGHPVDYETYELENKAFTNYRVTDITVPT